MRPLLILIAILASLCLPAVALAQSAGDEQYTDPFAQQDQAPAEQEQPAPPPSGTPAEPAPGGNGDAEAAPAEAEAGETASPTLPRTGAPVALLAAAGYALLLAGVAIRRQT